MKLVNLFWAIWALLILLITVLMFLLVMIFTDTTREPLLFTALIMAAAFPMLVASMVSIGLSLAERILP